MSLELGRIECTILRTMQAAPDQAFTAKQLCDVVYPLTVKRRHRRHAVIHAGMRLAEVAMVDSTMLYVRYLRKWRGSDRGMVFFNAANFASCRQAKEIVGFGYSDSAVASDLEIFAAERAGDAKLVAELEAKREAAINAYIASMLARSEITSRPSGSTTIAGRVETNNPHASGLDRVTLSASCRS